MLLPALYYIPSSINTVEKLYLWCVYQLLACDKKIVIDNIEENVIDYEFIQSPDNNDLKYFISKIILELNDDWDTNKSKLFFKVKEILLNKSVSLPPFNLDSSLVSLDLKVVNNTIVDTSPLNHQILSVQNVQIVNNNIFLRQDYYFSYFIIQHHNYLNINDTTDWTLEFWLNNYNVSSSTNPMIWNKGIDSIRGVRIWNGNNGYFEFAPLATNAIYIQGMIGTNINDSSWTHTAVSFSKSENNKIRGFKNGNLIFEMNGNFNFDNTRNLYIGLNTENGSGGWNYRGYINRIRLTRQCLYKNNFISYVTFPFNI